MKNAILLVMCFLLCGCLSEEAAERRKIREQQEEEQAKAEREKAKADHRNKMNSLKQQKILNIRENSDSIDFILEDGTIVTFYVYQLRNYRSGNYYYDPYLGVK